MTKHLTRQNLFDLVWAEPMSRLSKRLGISDVGLSKVCKKANIPTPGLGYWAKLDAGKKPPRPLLPPRGPGMLDWVTFTGMSVAEGPTETEESDTAYPEIEYEDLLEIEREVREVVGKVTLPKSLSSPHRLIARLLQQDEVRLQKQQASPYPSIWDGPFFESQHERRRLRIMNGLFLALAKAGYGADISGREARELRAHINDQHITFRLDWAGKNFGKEKRYTREADNKPPFKLRLEFGESWSKKPGASWEDNDETRLEDHLTEIVVSLIVGAEKQLRDAIKWHKEWEVQKKVHDEKMKREQEAAREKSRIDGLHQAAAQWRKACDIRDYVTAMRNNENPDGVTVDGKPLLEWCAWAMAQADKIDPTLPKKD